MAEARQRPHRLLPALFAAPIAVLARDARPVPVTVPSLADRTAQSGTYV